jgi:hypothetical protein
MADAPHDTHEWVSFADPDEDRTWTFDLTFLLSPWTCIYGHGCPGVLTGPAPELEHGCCSYGAHFTDAADVKRVRQAAKALTAEQWQFKRRGERKGIVKKGRGGEVVTRLVDDACIFLNRPGFPAGAGCALHQVALARGIEPLELKPDVCWQLPLRREDAVDERGHVTSTVRQWDRVHWGVGGADFHWWCTESPEAFVGHRPVHEAMAAELRALTGDAAYDLLVAYLAERASRRTPLPHPALRRP